MVDRVESSGPHWRPSVPANATYINTYEFEGFSIIVVAIAACMVLYICHAGWRTTTVRRAHVASAQVQVASPSMPHLDARADSKVEEPAEAHEQEPADDPPPYSEILLRSA